MYGEGAMNLEEDVPKEHESQESGGLLGGIRKLRDRASATFDQAAGGKLRQGLDTTREKVSDVGNTVTGTKFRQQFEDFTDVVATTVIGVHRDQRAVKDSLTQLQVVQTGIKLTLYEIQQEQGTVKEALVQVREDQGAVRETLRMCNRNRAL